MIFGFQIFISLTLMIKNLKKWGFHMDLQLLHLLCKKCMVSNHVFALIYYNLGGGLETAWPMMKRWVAGEKRKKILER